MSLFNQVGGGGFKQLKNAYYLGQNLPYYFFNGSAVVLNNEIHILGSQSYLTKHYKWDGSSWKSVSTLPSDFYRGAAAVVDNKIHIQGYNQGHYIWNGKTLTSAANAPGAYDHYFVTFNNELHSISGTDHYKWNGSSWTEVSTIPFEVWDASVVVFNNAIHLLGGDANGDTKHYTWDGSSWKSVSTLPKAVSYSGAAVLNNEIHLLCGLDHYTWDGSSWKSISALPLNFENGAVVTLDNTMYIFGLGNSYNNDNSLALIKFSDIYTKV
jgi:N-acetylneuraminic acid mutarotase